MVILGEYGKELMIEVFITGASGFLGGHLAKLSAEKYSTVGAYHSYKFDIPEVKSVYCDLSKPELLKDLFDSDKPDIIIHNAAYPNPDKCEENPDLAFKINTESTGAIAKWAERNNCRLVFIIHLGGSERISRYEFGEKLCDILGLPNGLIRETKYDDAAVNTPRPKDVSLNISRASSFLKTPFLNVDKGLKEICQ